MFIQFLQRELGDTDDVVGVLERTTKKGFPDFPVFLREKLRKREVLEIGKGHVCYRRLFIGVLEARTVMSEHGGGRE